VKGVGVSCDHVLSYQAWWQNGRMHRQGRPALRVWNVAENGSRVLQCEAWARHGSDHRVGGPAFRDWTVGPDGVRTLGEEGWLANEKLPRVDGPVDGKRCFYLQNKEVAQQDLPWLRRGQPCLTVLAGAPGAGHHGAGDEGSPAWSQDLRVAMTTGVASASYGSVVGGAVLLCV